MYFIKVISHEVKRTAVLYEEFGLEMHFGRDIKYQENEINIKKRSVSIDF